MRQLIQSYRSGEMKIENVPAPGVRSGGVLVRTSRSLVSAGTEKMIVDLAQKSLLGKARTRPDLVRKVVDTARSQGILNTFRKVQSKLDTPIPLGYSNAGVVVAVGDGVSEYTVGDRVACGGAGYANHADYCFVPRNLTARIPEDVGFEEAAFATVGAIALQGVRQAAPTLGESVGVLGLGLIGQLAAQLLRANGCRVFGFDPDPDRARLAEEMGAHCAVSSEPEQAAEQFTRGRGLDAVIVSASTPSAGPLAQAGELSRLRGRVVVVGLVGMEIPRSLYYRKELDVRMSMSYGPGRYDPDFEERGFDYPLAHVRWTEQRNIEAFLSLSAEGKLHLSPLVTHRFSIDNALDAYSLIQAGREPFLGVVLDYSNDEEEPRVPESSIEIQRQPIEAAAVGVGVIGSGGFASSVILPSLRASGIAQNVAIASASGMTARLLGEKNGFQIASANADEVIAHPDVNAVFVLTRHNLHASLAIKALEAGKYVFTEKPLALSEDEVSALIATRNANHGELMVGFNRRFAPLVEEIQGHFAGRTHPLMIQYRVNAGFIPAEHWVHDPREGGGRILGEACHFVDLAHFLAGAPPVRVYAESITGDSRFRADDNVLIQLKFADGSIASILYTAMGDHAVSKEFIEVFGEGKVARLDDFRRLELYDKSGRRRVRSANQDKGFDQEIALFLNAVRTGDEAPIPFKESVATTRATLAATESLRTGLPQSL